MLALGQAECEAHGPGTKKRYRVVPTTVFETPVPSVNIYQSENMGIAVKKHAV